MQNRTINSVMVISSASGAGHIRAADALTLAFENKGITAKHIEVLKYTNPVFRKIYSDLYRKTVNKNPDLFGWVYKTFDKPWKYQKRRLALDLLNTVRFVKFIKKEKPELVICTHLLPAEIILHLKRKKILDVPVGIVVTDFYAHAMWLYKDVDWYFVACEETKVYMESLGIPSKTIFVTGIPIDPVFEINKTQKETRIRLGLDADLETILVSAGGFGVGPVESMINSIDTVKHHVQIAVVCGRNPQLENRLRKNKSTNHPIKIIGFTKEIDEWMAASDLLVGKAGALTSSEAFARGLVLVIVNPIPGQEERNSDHFLEKCIALRCNNIAALGYKINALLSDKKRFSRMQENARNFARPNSAAEIAEIVLNEMGK